MCPQEQTAFVLQRSQLFYLFTERPAPSSCQKTLELSLKLQPQHQHTPEKAARHLGRLLSSQLLLAVTI